MKKRLRKKKLVGEFTRYGFRMTITTTFTKNDWQAWDTFVDQLIDFAVANEMGITGCDDIWVCGNKPKGHLLRQSRCCSLTDSHRVRMAAWLDHHEAILSYRIGGLVNGNDDDGYEQSMLAADIIAAPAGAA